MIKKFYEYKLKSAPWTKINKLKHKQLFLTTLFVIWKFQIKRKFQIVSKIHKKSYCQDVDAPSKLLHY